MKVEMKISADIEEPYVMIYTNKITDEVQKIMSLVQNQNHTIVVDDNEKMVVLQPEDIFMIRMEQTKLMVYCESNIYSSKKRLYEMGTQLGRNFMQISKSTFVNLKKIDCVEPSFNGMMNLRLRNGCTEYISRKYLSEFKKYLGI